MKRDWFTVRRILLALEDCPTGDMTQVRGLSAADPDAVQYHLLLLQDAGWIERVSKRIRMTMSGHDALAVMRDEQRFRKAVSHYEQSLGGVSWSVLQRVLKCGIAEEIAGTRDGSSTGCESGCQCRLCESEE